MLQDDIEHFGSLDDHVESFLSQDGADGRDLYGTLKQSPTEPKAEPPKGNYLEILNCMVKILYIVKFTWKPFPFQASLLLRWTVYVQGVRSQAVTSLRMGNFWLVLGMTRRYGVLDIITCGLIV